MNRRYVILYISGFFLNVKGIFSVFELFYNMRTLLLFQMLVIIAVSLSAQTLAGITFDKANQEPVSSAYVYLEGSSLYDVTNADGKFEITVNAVVNLPLVISHISYQTMTISNPFNALPDTIFLEEKETSLGEVVVEAGKYSRRQLLRAFRREFLGTSTTSQSCIIENENKIDIWFNRLTHTLSASCNEPVLIHNRYLGYKIYLTLEKFEVEYSGRQLDIETSIRTLLEGFAFFEDLDPFNKIIAKRRERTFIGSSAHFLRSLANGQLGKTYWLYDKGDTEPLPASKYVTVIDSTWMSVNDASKPFSSSSYFTVIDSCDIKEIRVNQRLKAKDFATYHGWIFWGEIGIKSIRKEVSDIIFYNDTFFIDSWGNLSQPWDLFFRGFMGKQRVGDMLPVNYGIEF